MQFERTIAGKRVVNSGSVGMPYEDEPGAYWTLDLEPPHAVRPARRSRMRPRGGGRALHRIVASDLVPVGRVGRPHGLDGAFFVEGRASARDVFAVGAALLVGGEPVKVVASKRGSQGRPVIRLDRRVDRGARARGRRATRCPRSAEDEYYVFQLVGLEVEEEGGRVLGRVSDVLRVPCERRPRARFGPVAAARRSLRAEGRPRAAGES